MNILKLFLAIAGIHAWIINRGDKQTVITAIGVLFFFSAKKRDKIR